MPTAEDQSGLWKEHAKRILDSRALLFSELETLSQNVTFLKQREIAKCGRLAYMFSSNLSSESITNPHIRSAPLKKERLRKLAAAMSKARAAVKPTAASEEVDDGGLLQDRGDSVGWAGGSSIVDLGFAPPFRSLESASGSSPLQT